MQIIHLVECDFGPKLGRAWVERSSDNADEKSILNDLIAGQFQTPIIRILRVEMRNQFLGGVVDVTSEFGEKLFHHWNYKGGFHDVPAVARDLINRAGHNVDKIDEENAELDRIFVEEMNKRMSASDREWFRLYGEVA